MLRCIICYETKSSFKFKDSSGECRSCHEDKGLYWCPRCKSYKAEAEMRPDNAWCKSCAKVSDTDFKHGERIECPSCNKDLRPSRYRGDKKECLDCLRAQGIFWCSTGKHFVRKADLGKSRNECRPCNNLRQAEMTKDSYLQRKRRHAKHIGIFYDLASNEIPDRPKQGDIDKYDPELKAEDVFRWELDRLDNESSYIPGNVTWTSHNSNASKHKLTIEEMRELAGRNIEDNEKNGKLIRRQRICRNVLKIYDAHQETRDHYWREKTQAAARRFLRRQRLLRSSKRDNGRV